MNGVDAVWQQIREVGVLVPLQANPPAIHLSHLPMAIGTVSASTMTDIIINKPTAGVTADF
jgi:hypothetical protein